MFSLRHRNTILFITAPHKSFYSPSFFFNINFEFRRIWLKFGWILNLWGNFFVEIIIVLWPLLIFLDELHPGCCLTGFSIRLCPITYYSSQKVLIGVFYHWIYTRESWAHPASLRYNQEQKPTGKKVDWLRVPISLINTRNKVFTFDIHIVFVACKYKFTAKKRTIGSNGLPSSSFKIIIFISEEIVWQNMCILKNVPLGTSFKTAVENSEILVHFICVNNFR